jgi:ADP-ribosylglycohydrolase
MDTFMLDTLGRERLGTMEEPVNKFITPGAITTAIPVGLISDGKRMPQPEIDRLAAETVALTHGGALAFLTGGVIAHMISGILRRPDCSLESLALDAVDAVEDQLGRQYSQFSTIRELVQLAVSLAKTETENPVAAMEQLVCDNCAQVLAGAIYACIVSRGDFDTAMITAVNHSGSSAAVGALTGAFLGAALGEEALPEFYLECLEAGQVLQTLATDLWQCYDKPGAKRLFDMEWDRKYTHGLPVERDGWSEDI